METEPRPCAAPPGPRAVGLLCERETSHFRRASRERAPPSDPRETRGGSGMIRRSLYSLTVATCLASLVTCSRENHKPQSSPSQQSAVAVKNESDKALAVCFDHIRPQKLPGRASQVLIATPASITG